MLTKSTEHIFIVSLGTFDPKEKERRADLIRTSIMDWDFVSDVLDFDADGEDDAEG